MTHASTQEPSLENTHHFEINKNYSVTQGERERETDRETDRDRERQRQKDRDREQLEKAG